MFKIANILALIALMAVYGHAESQSPVPRDPSIIKVPLLGIFEKEFTQKNTYQNPYLEVKAEALITYRNKRKFRIPLFWNGNHSWIIRYSPPEVGLFEFKIESNDEGLNNQDGMIEVYPSSLKGGIRARSDYPHHFEYQNGAPFFFIGDTEWSLFADNHEKGHTRSTIAGYIKRRSQQRFNVVTSALLHQFGWGNAGGLPFHDFKNETLNTEYWEEVDWRIRYLNAHGITAGLVLSWASSPVGYDYGKFNSNKAIERYAKYIASRYGAFNVYFIVAGEFDEARYNYKKIGQIIEKQRYLTED